jgi:hypothetical protein
MASPASSTPETQTPRMHHGIQRQTSGTAIDSVQTSEATQLRIELERMKSEKSMKEMKEMQETMERNIREKLEREMKQKLDKELDKAQVRLSDQMSV